MTSLQQILLCKDLAKHKRKHEKMLDFYITIIDGGGNLKAKLCGSKHSVTIGSIGTTAIEVYSRRPRKPFHVFLSFFMLKNGIENVM
ncbi:hypothetical protein AC249_AIPGENE28901 [Exaiptasia diaphana]|nr:hypothetical protein AC249_AIPGENE28901 [Exaiptasia diaphana]